MNGRRLEHPKESFSNSESLLNILMITSGASLIPPCADIGGNRYRLCRYGEIIGGRMDVIAKTYRSQKAISACTFHMSKSVTLFPTCSWNTGAFLYDALKMGCKLMAKHRYHLIVTQESPYCNPGITTL